MIRSNDYEEELVKEYFTPFIEKLTTDPHLKLWQPCPIATTKEEIAMAEQALWYPLPESYRMFLLAWNGFNTSAAADERTTVSFLCCCNFLTGEFPDERNEPKLLDIVRGNSPGIRWGSQPADMVNIATDLFGNAYMLGEPSRRESLVFHWDHDDGAVTQLADTFPDWLNALPENLL